MFNGPNFPTTFIRKRKRRAARTGPTFGSGKISGDANVCSGTCRRCGKFGLVGPFFGGKPEKRTCANGCKRSDLARVERRVQRVKDRKRNAKKLPPITLVVRDDTLPPVVITTGQRIRNERAEHRFHQRQDHVRSALAAARSK